MNSRQVKTGLVAGVLIIAFSGAAWAGNGYHKRRHHQKQKISSGVASGMITKKERIRLGKEQRRIAQMRNGFLCDGRLNHHERARLARMQNNAARHIYQAKHNSAVQRYRKKAHRHDARRHAGRHAYNSCSNDHRHGGYGFFSHWNDDHWKFGFRLHDHRR